MSNNPSLLAGLATLFNRLSKEELHYVGNTLLQQASYVDYKQHQTYPPCPSHHSPNGPPSTQQIIQSIPPLMNHQQYSSRVRPLMDQQYPVFTSSPRRPASNGNGNQQHSSEEVLQHHNTLVPTKTRHPFSINVLKRAVTNKLPCFFIIFDQTIDISNIPSSTQVAIMLKKTFAVNHLRVKELSLCVQAGDRRFKFAVSNKKDFLTIYNWSGPEHLEDKKVELIKPHSLPDCLSMVVRYIPIDINSELARTEIMKAIPAAVAFSMLHYQYRKRPSYDIRFSVRNFNQYQTALELGRITIGQYYLPVTEFLASYRLTYCTACWKLGHMREKCQSPTCCRKCLVPYVNGVKHSCQGEAISCAQCGGNHSSLSSTCPIVKQYREDLKVTVNKALASGLIKRTTPGEQACPFQQQAEDFPELFQTSNQSRTQRTGQISAPGITAYKVEKAASKLEVEVKALTDTIDQTENKLNEMNNRIEIQDKCIKLQSKSTSAIIDTLQMMSRWMQANNSVRSKLKKNVNKMIENLQKWQQKLDTDIKNMSSLSESLLQSTNTNNNNNNKINEREVDLLEEDLMNFNKNNA